MNLYTNQSVYYFLPNALFMIVRIMWKQPMDFQLQLCTYVCQIANLKSSTAIDQYVVILLLHGMHIKESLVCDKHTGDLIGFTDLIDINSHHLVLEQSLTDPKSYPPLASTVMTFMVI